MSTKRPSFSHTLPAELRLQIYGYVLDNVGVPTSAELRPYIGLIMSSKIVYREFEAEAIKGVNEFLTHLQENWTATTGPLRLMELKTLPESIKIKIGVPKELLKHRSFRHDRPIGRGSLVDALSRYYDLKPFLETLIQSLSSFSLYLWDHPRFDFAKIYSFAHKSHTQFPQTVDGNEMTSLSGRRRKKRNRACHDLDKPMCVLVYDRDWDDDVWYERGIKENLKEWRVEWLKEEA